MSKVYVVTMDYGFSDNAQYEPYEWNGTIVIAVFSNHDAAEKFISDWNPDQFMKEELETEEEDRLCDFHGDETVSYDHMMKRYNANTSSRRVEWRKHGFNEEERWVELFNTECDLR